MCLMQNSNTRSPACKSGALPTKVTRSTVLPIVFSCVSCIMFILYSLCEWRAPSVNVGFPVNITFSSFYSRFRFSLLCLQPCSLMWRICQCCSFKYFLPKIPKYHFVGVCDETYQKVHGHYNLLGESKVYLKKKKRKMLFSLKLNDPFP